MARAWDGEEGDGWRDGGAGEPPPQSRPYSGDRVATGRAFEGLAADYLARRGMTILHRNYRDGPREIDLVARDGQVIVFVEVKGRARLDYGHPFHGIGIRKRKDVEAAARRWLREHPREAAPSSGVRFDAVGILPDPTRSAGDPGAGRENPGWVVHHLRDAWRPGLC